MRKTTLFLSILLVINAGCYRVPDKIEPELSYTVQDRYVQNLPTIFPPLSSSEKGTGWGQEYLIGITFARQLDFYRAITTFKRALILIPQAKEDRILQLNYFILLSYYLGERYHDVIYTFENSQLKQASTSFPAYHDLLILLYESYQEIGDETQARRILEHIKHTYPDTGADLTLSEALREGNIEDLKEITPPNQEIETLIHSYELERKSISKAQSLNAVIPGAGYLYVGQKQSALTAFLLNGLFIAAAVHFFNKKEYAAAIITTSFEAGWYFGGIYGAGEAAKLYNERLYESKACRMLKRDNLFPVLQIQYGF